MEKGRPEDNRPDQSGRKNAIGWGMVAAVIAIVILLAAYQALQGGGTATVPPDVCAGKAVAYVNSHLVRAGTSAELKTITEAGGVYKINVQYEGITIPLYATKDCTRLFTESYTITAAETCDPKTGNCPQTTVTPDPASEDPVRTARPSVELYVMSFCPFSVPMEEIMQPVEKLLRDSADIRVRYIATVGEDSLATAESLHGRSEALEDARQLCIAKYYPGSYWDYLAAFNARCYPDWSSAAKLSACQKNVTAALGIPAEAIDRCVSGSEGLQLLKADEAAVDENKAYSSPTLFINGQEYRGPRSPEAVKQAICSHFENRPAACDTVLSSQAATVTGNC